LKKQHFFNFISDGNWTDCLPKTGCNVPCGGGNLTQVLMEGPTALDQIHRPLFAIVSPAIQVKYFNFFIRFIISSNFILQVP
jgi:hypothetical protein